MEGSVRKAPGALSALGTGWGMLGADPVRLSLASAWCLLVDLAFGQLAYTLATTNPTHAVGWAVSIGIAIVVASPARARILSLGASAQANAPDAPRRGLFTIALVDILSRVSAAAVFGAVLLGTSIAASALAAQGVWPGAVVVMMGGAGVGYLAALFPRAALAMALPAAAVDGGGPISAFRTALTARSGTWSFAARVLLIGDILRLIGATACIVGALPAYPLPYLALTARHLQSRGGTA